MGSVCNYLWPRILWVASLLVPSLASLLIASLLVPSLTSLLIATLWIVSLHAGRHAYIGAPQ